MPNPARFVPAEKSCRLLATGGQSISEVGRLTRIQNGGHCQPLLFDRSPEVAAFELRNVAAVESFIKKHNVPCEWQETTGCRTFWRQDLMDEAEAEIAKLREAKPEISKLVTVVKDKKELKKYRVQAHARGATLTQGAASLWPYKYVAFMVEKLVKEGKLNLQTSTPVTNITTRGNSSGKCTLETPRGPITARHVILATNGYTSYLLHELSSIIVPIRCEMSALAPPKGSSRLEYSYGFVGANGSHPNHDDYLIQRPFSESIVTGKHRGGHLMYGGGRGHALMPCINVSDDDVIDQGEAQYLRRTLLTALDLGGNASERQELEASHEWTGIKGYSRDNNPWVGLVPGKDGIWLSGGYSGHGMPNATLCGRAVVEMVLGVEAGDELERIQERLVEKGEIPREYLISSQRLDKAMQMPTVAEVEQDDGPADGQPSSEARKEARDRSGAQRSKGSRCSVM